MTVKTICSWTNVSVKENDVTRHSHHCCTDGETLSFQYVLCMQGPRISESTMSGEGTAPLMIVHIGACDC